MSLGRLESKMGRERDARGYSAQSGDKRQLMPCLSNTLGGGHLRLERSPNAL